MNRDQITTAYFGISELMNVGDAGAGDRTLLALAACVVTQNLFIVEAKNRFLHQSLLDQNHAMRAVVIMNRRFLTGPPTNDQHFNRIVTANAMTPIVGFLESEVGLQIELGDLDCRKPGRYFIERRRGCLAVESFDQRRKRECTVGVERFVGVSSFGVDLCRQELGSERKSRAQVLYSFRRV